MAKDVSSLAARQAHKEPKPRAPTPQSNPTLPSGSDSKRALNQTLRSLNTGRK